VNSCCVIRLPPLPPDCARAPKLRRAPALLLLLLVRGWAGRRRGRREEAEKGRAGCQLLVFVRCMHAGSVRRAVAVQPATKGHSPHACRSPDAG
jgi:hypothetical protein